MTENEKRNTGKERVEITEEEAMRVSGGEEEEENWCEVIMQYIEAGNDFMAREYFNMFVYSLAPLDAYTLRMTFLTKFGYPIDKFGN